MNPTEIGNAYQRLKEEAAKIPEPGMSNDHHVLAQYKRILNDLCALGRNLSQWAATKDRGPV